MFLGNLLKSIKKDHKKIPIEGISFDSRKVKKKNIFFAIDGNKTSGNKYINQAVKRGASVIISEKKFKSKISKVPLITVKNVRKSLAEACSNYYKKKPKKIIAVTGTNGKSSVADFFYQILNINKKSAASIGTLGVVSKKFKKKTNLTSADPLFLHQSLRKLIKNKTNSVILEASSHGLDQKRLDYLNIDIGIFTNLSHDHLDYHKSMKTYLNSKMHLFKKLLKKNSKIIVDRNSKEFKTIRKIVKKRKIKLMTIGSTSSNINMLENTYKKSGQSIKISINSKNYFLEIPLIGFFQIKNLLMAALAASQCNIDIKDIFKNIHKIKPVPGRLENIESLNNNSNIILDYAHTPDALEQSLIALKNQFKKEIIIVFGCGGDRDIKKRFTMGKIAKKYCRKVFVTDDNPRNENSKKIRESILKGCKNLSIGIADRRKAIERAISELNPNEVLLVAGKGHEENQDFGSKIIKFSDRQVIKKAIQKIKRKYTKNYWPNFIGDKVFKNKNINFNGVSINTRSIKKNNLFIALSGKKTDGHKFIKSALRKGAAKLVINKNMNQVSINKYIKVKNTFSALNSLANITRRYSCAKIIGITGSVGKTTLKNLIGFSLKKYGKVYSSPHSYNNKFGVPLSISNLDNTTDYGVFEIGMDKKGEIHNLSKMVKPEIAVITNVSSAHLENFSSLKGIALAKAEIINNIIEEGSIVLNKDNKFFSLLSEKAKNKKINIISFSTKKKAHIYLISIKKYHNYKRLKLNIKNKIFYFDIKHSTENFIENILAAVSVLNLLGLNLKKLQKVFINFEIPSGRGDIKIIRKFNKKFKFIDESYNANPLSMLSAIKNMNYYKKEKKQKNLVFLGDMLELGKKSKQLHVSLSKEINKSNIDKIFVYGKNIKETYKSVSFQKRGMIFNSLNEAYNHFSKILDNNDLLMVKGSNATGLNRFSKNIKKGQIGVI